MGGVASFSAGDRMTTEKAPSKEAMAIAHPLCRNYSCDWQGTKKQEAECSEQCCLNIAAALEAFAATVNNHIRLTYESEHTSAEAFKVERDALRARNVALVALADKWDFEQT